MQISRFFALFFLFFSSSQVLANTCADLNGTWTSSQGNLNICNGQLKEPTKIWKIHSLLCIQDKIRVISSNGGHVLITGYPNKNRHLGDSLTLYNGKETLALYYEGSSCNT